jgi:hypothetical protein
VIAVAAPERRQTHQPSLHTSPTPLLFSPYTEGLCSDIIRFAHARAIATRDPHSARPHRLRPATLRSLSTSTASPASSQHQRTCASPRGEEVQLKKCRRPRRPSPGSEVEVLQVPRLVSRSDSAQQRLAWLTAIQVSQAPTPAQQPQQRRHQVPRHYLRFRIPLAQSPTGTQPTTLP